MLGRRFQSRLLGIRQWLNFKNYMIIRKQIKQGDVIYSRDPVFPLWFIMQHNVKIVLELHQIRYLNKIQTAFYNNCIKLSLKLDIRKKMKFVIISKVLEYWLQNYMGIDYERLLVAPSGVSLDDALQNENMSELESKLFSSKKIKCLYAGNLSADKGIVSILQLAEISPEMDFIILGGSAEEIHTTKNRIKGTNVYFLGKKDPRYVKTYTHKADYLLMLNNSKKGLINDVTSPVKLFEYMAR